MSSVHKLIRDCAATLIPAGDIVVLEAGSEVTVSQALGGSVTVRTGMGLFRIAPADLDALGQEAIGLYGEQPKNEATGPLNQDMLWEALKGCFDPEIPVNIVDLGLVYSLKVDPLDNSPDRHSVVVSMTLTAPGCGMGPVIAEDARNRVLGVPGINQARVDIVWDPPWTQTMISEDGKMQLGLI